jgi:hypothetical protein
MVCLQGSRDSAVVTTTGYELDDRGIGDRASVGQEFLPFHLLQKGSGAHPAPYPMCMKDPYPGVKRPGREADHSSPTSVEVKKIWISLFHKPSRRSA